MIGKAIARSIPPTTARISAHTQIAPNATNARKINNNVSMLDSFLLLSDVSVQQTPPEFFVSYISSWIFAVNIFKILFAINNDLWYIRHQWGIPPKLIDTIYIFSANGTETDQVKILFAAAVVPGRIVSWSIPDAFACSGSRLLVEPRFRCAGYPVFYCPFPAHMGILTAVSAVNFRILRKFTAFCVSRV